MFKTLNLKNFTAFKDLVINFSSGVNIIMGENSTGKTHILKAIDGLARIMNYHEVQENDPIHKVRCDASSLINTFDPRCNLIDLFNNKLLKTSELVMKLHNEDRVKIVIDINEPYINATRAVNSKNCNSVFIPSKEMMFFLPEFVSLMKKFESWTDSNHQNIATDIIVPKMKKNLLHGTSIEVIKDIETLLSGTFKVEADLSMTFHGNGYVRPAKLMAEGYRKFGILSRLIESGCIFPGFSGPLLWDEPETNLDPIMMRTLVEILVKLSKAGLQLILVSQNYVFIKWFQLLFDSNDDNQILYHNLIRDKDTSEIKVETYTDYTDIESNSIDAAYEDILNTQLIRDMEKY